MTNFGTRRTHHNINTLPLWAREYILTGSITGRKGNVNTLPRWGRDLVAAKRKEIAHNRVAEKEHRKEHCKGCRYYGKCSPKRTIMCDELSETPPC